VVVGLVGVVEVVVARKGVDFVDVVSFAMILKDCFDW